MSNLDSETKERLGGDVSVPAHFIENLIDMLNEDSDGYESLISKNVIKRRLNVLRND